MKIDTEKNVYIGTASVRTQGGSKTIAIPPSYFDTNPDVKLFEFERVPGTQLIIMIPMLKREEDADA